MHFFANENGKGSEEANSGRRSGSKSTDLIYQQSSLKWDEGKMIKPQGKRKNLRNEESWKRSNHFERAQITREMVHKEEGRSEDKLN